MKRTNLIITLFFTMCFQSVFAQHIYQKSDSSSSFVFHFRFSSHLLEKEYMDNKHTLEKFTELLGNKDVSSSLGSIQVVTSASPDGCLEYNVWLTRQRARAIKGYIVWKCPNIVQQSIHTTMIGENWNGLRELVEADPHVPSKEMVLAVIDTDINPGTKKWRLKQIQSGESWRYIEQNFLIKLRSGITCVVSYKIDSIPEPKIEIKEAIPTPAPEPEVESVVEEIKPIIPDPVAIKRPLFAVKTNMLADVLSCLNIELEVPLGERWSVSGELMTPWWRKSNSDLTMQLLLGNGAVKYWFGDRSRLDVMTGWSLGLYGGGGKYDIQLFGKKGTQGEFFNAGLQAGYAHKIGKVLRLEYSVSLGFLRNNYKEYTKVTDTKYNDIKVFEYPWETKQLDWVGPTNAKISLVWLLNYKTNKGVGKR